MSAVHAVVTTTPQHNIATKAVSHHESLQSCVNELFKLPNVGWEPGHFLSAPRPDDSYGEIPLDRFILDRLLVPTNLPSVTIAQKRQAEIEKCKDDVLKEPPNGGNAQQTWPEEITLDRLLELPSLQQFTSKQAQQEWRPISTE